MKPSPERISLLNQGKIETSNLMDALAIDFHLLIDEVFSGFKLPAFQDKCGITKKMFLTALALYEKKGFNTFDTMMCHTSDTIRGLACYVLAHHEASISRKLEWIKPLADDNHFGVREWAWIALRPEVILNLSATLEILKPWVLDPSEKIRRYACEILRPRGVWCAHIKEMRQQPWQALPLLEPLKNDPAKYVQLSVANWLNDAGKDHPSWVIDLCDKWIIQSPTSHTQKICKRALRNLK